MRFRKPEAIPLLFITGAVALFLALGIWQIQRLHWKNGLVAAIEEAQAKPPITTLPQQLGGLNYRRVALTGAFLNDKMMHAIGPAPGIGEESEAGFHVMTPFKLQDGRIILIDRGFAPPGKEGSPQGVQTVQGIIRPPHRRNIFSPDNNPAKNIWFYDDIPGMAHATSLTLTPLIVEEVGPRQPGVYPIPSDGRIVLRNDHLQYAITWLAFAVIAIVMFGFYHRISEQKHDRL